MTVSLRITSGHFDKSDPLHRCTTILLRVEKEGVIHERIAHVSMDVETRVEKGIDLSGYDRRAMESAIAVLIIDLLDKPLPETSGDIVEAIDYRIVDAEVTHSTRRISAHKISLDPNTRIKE